MSVEEDRWHVRFAPGEVKVLTLEQVDDLFRLDMIDEDTLLRQEGTEQWLPLRVVAGLDEDEPAPPAVVRSAPPPPPVPLPPPSSAPASERAPFAPSPSFIPPAPVARSAPPPPPPPAAPRSVAPPAASVPPPAPSYVPPAPSYAPPIAPLAPVSLAPPRANRAESLLIGLAALLGLLVALHRNGALAELFASAGQAGAYQGLERALGGPGLGTPRAVGVLVAQTPALARSTAPTSAKP